MEQIIINFHKFIIKNLFKQYYNQKDYSHNLTIYYFFRLEQSAKGQPSQLQGDTEFLRLIKRLIIHATEAARIIPTTISCNNIDIYYINNEPIWNTKKAHNHAIRVLYNTENKPHFQLPASLATAVIDAMQGTYSDTNIKKVAAINGVKSATPVDASG